MKLYEIYKQYPIICTDSRACLPDSIFFALKGENFDANTFALTALEQGCAYAIVDNKKYAVDKRIIVVDNVLETLQELARHHRRQLKTTIIGITGTNGKTTTKELIASVLKQKFNTHYTQGNFNNHIGVPLTLLQLTAQHEIAVIEIGANHQGEIKALAEIAEPDYGIITNVGEAHLEGFGSFEGVKKAKAELYDFIRQKNGKIFLNAENQHLKEMAGESGFTDKNSILTYTIGSDTENKSATGTVTSNNPHLAMRCMTSKGGFDVKTQLIGAYNAENVIAAVAIGDYFGLTTVQIQKGLENYRPQNNRSQFVCTNRNRLIVDTYNANPSSMQAAILNFARLEAPEKTLIIGDMLELGDRSECEHRKIIDLINENGFSDVYLVGKHFGKTNSRFQSFEHVEELKKHLRDRPLQGHFILIKGSRGIHLEEITDEL